MRTCEMVDVDRFESNPLIWSSEKVGSIVNHPSIIKVPSWVENPLGKYYLYFSHKFGNYIRMAYADNIEGPWEVYEPGTVHIDETPFIGHIASPDVHVDEKNQYIRMYLHGETKVRDLIRTTSEERPYRRERHDYTKWSLPHRAAYEWGRTLFNKIDSEKRNQTANSSGTSRTNVSSTEEHSSLKKLLRKKAPRPSAVQETRHLRSTNGIDFHSPSPILGPSWFAVFTCERRYYALARDGYVYVADSATEPFSRKTRLFTDHRHFGVHVDNDILSVYYSRPRDDPESILRAEVELKQDITEWETSDPVTVILPEMKYEGVDVNNDRTTDEGPWDRQREVRDPEIYQENGSKYLFYAIAGQSGIAAAKLRE